MIELNYERREGEFRGDRELFITTHLHRIQGVDILPGFLTDFVSAKKSIRKHMDPKQLELMKPAALLHDWLCNMTNWSKWKCNWYFLRQMKADGVSFRYRWLSWLYVSRPFAPRVNWSQPHLIRS